MSVATLADLLRERQPCVVVTGAGISTESGIPDFRSETGIWAEVDPFEVASIQAFKRDPERVWRFYRTRIHSLLEAQPNDGHRALAELERRGLVQAIVTQNIDLLHARAGAARWWRCTGRSARPSASAAYGRRTPTASSRSWSSTRRRCASSAARS